ncbi:uncharacterized protein [Symphalangus syndactylus]|uniref:uncharacterized protein isoform X2 n=1 Tax=Symphalangus syndactylus TaxID=9590 RepID=UPI0030055F40
MGVAPLTITNSNLLATFLFPVSTTLTPASLEVLVPEGEMLPSRDTTMIPLNWKLRVPPGHFVLLISLNLQAKKGVSVLAEVIDPDYQGQTGVLPHNGSKEEYVWNAGDEKLQQPNSSRTPNGPDTSGMKIWFTLSDTCDIWCRDSDGGPPLGGPPALCSVRNIHLQPRVLRPTSPRNISPILNRRQRRHVLSVNPKLWHRSWTQEDSLPLVFNHCGDACLIIHPRFRDLLGLAAED